MIEYNIVYSLISILFILLFVFWVLQDYFVDKFRQEMFSLRDNLFDEAMNKKIAFNDKPYLMLRTSMNGFIRFGHRLNIWQIIFLNLYAHNGTKDHPTFNKKMDVFMKDFTEEQKSIFNRYHVLMNFYVLKYAIFSSTLLTLTVITPVIFFVAMKIQYVMLTKAYKSFMDRIDSAAFASGKSVALQNNNC